MSVFRGHFMHCALCLFTRHYRNCAVYLCLEGILSIVVHCVNLRSIKLLLCIVSITGHTYTKIVLQPWVTWTTIITTTPFHPPIAPSLSIQSPPHLWVKQVTLLYQWPPDPVPLYKQVLRWQLFLDQHHIIRLGSPRLPPHIQQGRPPLSLCFHIPSQ